MVKTSTTHPLRIAELPVGRNGGAVGVTFAPGKYQEVAMTGAWARDLNLDLAAIRSWGATHLISLIEPCEFEDLRIEDLPGRARKHGLKWIGLPITDGAAPDARLLDQWTGVSSELVQSLVDGGRVVVHCKGGLGRAGTVASMLLLDSGVAATAEEAMRSVRFARPGAIETTEQESFIHDWAQRLASGAGQHGPLG